MAFQRSRSARRPVHWVTGTQDSSAILTGTGKSLWTTPISGASGQAAEETIVRTRGGGRILLLSAGSAGDGYQVGLGICIQTDQAIAAGAASVPGPITDLDWDGWLWHGIFFVQSATATFSDGVNAAGVSVHYVIDSKAMRKWDLGAEQVIGVTEVGEFGVATMEHHAISRMLLKSG